MFEEFMDTLSEWDYLPEYDQPDYPGIRALFYSGLPLNGTPTKIFAYMGVPQSASPEKPVPAVVLVHGGGGPAFTEWVKVWNDREEAQAYFLEAMMNSDGAEHDRYSGIYIQLQNGLDYCTDEDDDEEDES